MELRELKLGALYWWQHSPNTRILVRVTALSTNFLGVRIVAATAEQVIASGYGVGEFAHLLPSALLLEKAA